MPIAASASADSAEDGHQPHVEALARGRTRDDLGHRADVRHRQAGGLSQRLLNLPAQRVGLAGRAHDPRHGRDADVEGVGEVRHLRLRDPHLRSGFFVERAVTTVGDDADDLPVGLGRELAHAAAADGQPVVERVALGPVLLRHRLVDDDDGRRRRGIARGERAPALDRDLEDLEVAGRHGVPGAASMDRLVGRERTANDGEAEAVAAFERHAAGGTGHLHARDRHHLVDADTHRLFDGFGLQVAIAGHRHPHRQHAAGVVARIDASQCHERPYQQRRADEQHQRQSDLRHDEHRARLVLLKAGAGRGCCFP